MKVSSHPAPVVTPNKDKERGSYFKIRKNSIKTPQRAYSLLKLPKKIKHQFIDSFFFFYSIF